MSHLSKASGTFADTSQDTGNAKESRWLLPIPYEVGNDGPGGWLPQKETGLSVRAAGKSPAHCTRCEAWFSGPRRVKELFLSHEIPEGAV